jgi:hypothetical protein
MHHAVGHSGPSKGLAVLSNAIRELGMQLPPFECPLHNANHPADHMV